MLINVDTVYSFEFAQSYFRPKQINPVLNSPTVHFSYIIIYT